MMLLLTDDDYTRAYLSGSTVDVVDQALIDTAGIRDTSAADPPVRILLIPVLEAWLEVS